jgi:hypothetical protein
MKYYVFYPDQPNIGIKIEAADPRAAAAGLFAQHPRFDDGCINVVPPGILSKVVQFRTPEFMDDAMRASLSAPTTISSGASTAMTLTHDPGRVATAATTRYRDGYMVASALNGIGGAVKGIGIAIGVIIALLSLAVGSSTNVMFGLLGACLGSAIAAPVFILGILISAQGQLMKATMDAAVHTSPFLDDNQKASTMSLK